MKADVNNDHNHSLSTSGLSGIQLSSEKTRQPIRDAKLKIAHEFDQVYAIKQQTFVALASWLRNWNFWSGPYVKYVRETNWQVYASSGLLQTPLWVLRPNCKSQDSLKHMHNQRWSTFQTGTQVTEQVCGKHCDDTSGNRWPSLQSLCLNP